MSPLLIILLTFSSTSFASNIENLVSASLNISQTYIQDRKSIRFIRKSLNNSELESKQDQFLDLFIKKTTFPVFVAEHRARTHKILGRIYDNWFLIDSLKSFEKIVEDVQRTEFQISGQYLVISVIQLQIQEIKRIFELLWEKYIVNVCLIQESKNHAHPEIFTYFPFGPDHCETVHPVKVPLNQMFPLKLNNFYQCPIIVTIVDIAMPFIIVKEDGNITGIDWNLVEILAEKFNFSIELKRINDWGASFPNGTATGSIEITVKRQTNFTIGAHAALSFRFGLMDNSETYYSTSFVLIVPPKIKSLAKITAPFSYEVWIGILFALITFGCFGLYFKFFGNHPFLKLFETLVGGNVSRISRNTLSRIIIGIWLTFCCFMGDHYIAKYVNLLTDKTELDIADTVQEMIDRNYTFYLLNGTEFNEDYPNINAVFPTYEKLLEYEDIVTTTPDFKGAVMETETFAWFRNMNSSYAPMIIAKEKLLDIQMCIFYPLSSPLRVIFNPILSHVRIAGLLGYWGDKVMRKTHLSALETVDGARPLTLKEFKEVFIVLAVGHLIAFVVFLVELLSMKYIKLRVLFSTRRN